MSLWRVIRAVVLLPGMVLGVVPAILVRIAGGPDPGWSLPAPWGTAVIAAGVLLIALGVSLMIRTIALFRSVGRGTLAPWDPTRRLVVLGPYRHVRNPMISGVMCVLLGEAILFGSVALLAWFACFALVNLIYIPLFEEPGLTRRFGEDYLLYRRNVPRWVPRFRPWRPPWDVS